MRRSRDLVLGTLRFRMSRDAARTVHSQQAMEITDLFSYKFGAQRFGEGQPRRLKLQAPDGPSTAGGLQARQSLVLLTDEEPPQTLMLGWIDSAMRRCEVKAHRALQLLHKQRFHKPLELSEAEFNRMVAELRGFLKIQKIDVFLIDSAPAAAAIPPRSTPAPTKAPMNPAVLAGFAAGLCLGVLLGYLVFSP